MRQNRGFKWIDTETGRHEIRRVGNNYEVKIDGKTYSAGSKDKVRRIVMKELWERKKANGQ